MSNFKELFDSLVQLDRKIQIWSYNYRNLSTFPIVIIYAAPHDISEEELQDGLWCPYCNYRLRMKPRNMKHKAKVKSIQTIQLADNYLFILHIRARSIVSSFDKATLLFSHYLSSNLLLPFVPVLGCSYSKNRLL
jgi:DNA-directed RNA polymerase subunit RPC12/RpoP